MNVGPSGPRTRGGRGMTEEEWTDVDVQDNEWGEEDPCPEEAKKREREAREELAAEVERLKRSQSDVERRLLDARLRTLVGALEAKWS